MAVKAIASSSGKTSGQHVPFAFPARSNQAMLGCVRNPGLPVLVSDQRSSSASIKLLRSALLRVAFHKCWLLWSVK